MIRAPLVCVALAGCGGGDATPRAWALMTTFGFEADGVRLDEACRSRGHLAEYSFRDLPKTSIRVDGGETDTCVVPVDWEHEQFVLQSIACRRHDQASTIVEVAFSVHSGRSGGVITLPLAGGLSASRDFGAGLVIDFDLEVFTVGGEGSCDVIGYYLDRGAPALGPVRFSDRVRRNST